MAERLKEKVLEVEKSVDLVAGPDSYKDLPRLLAVTRSDKKAVNVLLSLDETYADIMPMHLNEDSVTAFLLVKFLTLVFTLGNAGINIVLKMVLICSSWSAESKSIKRFHRTIFQGFLAIPRYSNFVFNNFFL